MSEDKKKKKLEDKLKGMVDIYNDKIKEYKALSDELNKMLGGIEAIDKLLKEEDA
jgi:hypothetical protein